MFVASLLGPLFVNDLLILQLFQLNWEAKWKGKRVEGEGLFVRGMRNFNFIFNYAGKCRRRKWKPFCLGAVTRKGRKGAEEERAQLQGKQMAGTRGSFEEPAWTSRQSHSRCNFKGLQIERGTYSSWNWKLHVISLSPTSGSQGSQWVATILCGVADSDAVSQSQQRGAESSKQSAASSQFG